MKRPPSVAASPTSQLRGGVDCAQAAGPVAAKVFPWLLFILSSLAYFTAQELAFLFPNSFGLVSSIWPAAGIALASLLLCPRRLWPALLACLFAAGIGANLTTDRPLLASLGFMVANICETAASAWLITRLCKRQISFTRVREIMALAGAAVLVNGATSLIGASTAQLAIGAQFWKFYWTWWVADGLGLLLVTPAIVIWLSSWRTLATLCPLQRFEAIALLLLGSSLAALEFGWHEEFSVVELASIWLPVFLIWAALRFGPLITVTVLGVYSLIVIICTASGLGTFPLGGSNETLHLLAAQVYLGVIGATGLVLAASVAQQRESQTLLRAVVEGTSDAVYVKDQQGRYLLFNSAAARFVGKTANEVIGRDDTCLFPPGEAKTMMEGDRISMGANAPRTYEEYLTGGGGEQLVFSSTKGPLRDETGALVGLFGIARDITARQRTEAALRDSEERHRAILQTAMNGFWLADTEGRILEVNEAYCRMSGFSASEVLTMRIADVEVCESPEETLTHIRKIMSLGEGRFETKQRRKDGRIFDVEINAQFRPVDGGRLVVFLHDITQRKRAETALRESEEKFANVFNDAPVMIALTDLADGTYLEVNEEALRVSGFTRKEVIGHTALELGWLTAEDRARLVEETKLDGRITAMELTCRAKSGDQRICLINGETMTFGGRTCLLTVTVDITARKQMEAALLKSEERHQLVNRAVNDGLWDWDLLTNKAYISPRWKEIIGYRDDELPNTAATHFENIHPDDRIVAQEAVRRHLEENAPYAIELRLRHKTGGYRWILTRGEALRDAEGKPVRMVGAITDITEHKLAGDAHKEALNRLRKIARQVPGMVYQYRLRPDGTATFPYSSEGIRELFRIPPEAVVNDASPLFACLHPEDAADVQTSILKSALDLTPWVHEFRLRYTDGTERWVAGNSLPQREPDGSTLWHGFATDITDRKQAEAALRETHDLIVKLTAQVPGVVYQYQLYPDGRSCFPFASPGMNDIYEVTPEEVQFDATPVFGRLHPEDYERVGSAIQESARALTPFHCEFRVVLPRQGLRWRLSAAVPERTKDGGTLWYGIISDITEQKRAEAALQASEQRYRSILNASPDDITLADLAGRILMVSPAGMKMFGYEREEDFLHRPVVDFLVPEDRQTAAKRIGLMFQDIAPGVNEYRGVRRDGSIFDLEVNSKFVRDETGKPTNIIFVARDVTARKSIEAALRSTLLEKEALLKEVHHRVKNNLQVITSLLRLEAGRSTQPGTRSVLEDMQGRIRSMAMLHESLYRSGTFAAVDLGVYLKQIATQLFRALVSMPGTVQLHLDLSSAPVEMDQAMPCGLLVNELVSNSLKHGFPNGRTGEVRLALHRVKDGRQLRLNVSDSGVGLPPDTEANKNRTLGLQLVGDLARQVEGTLEVGPGPGASFTVTFTPRMDAISPPLATQSTPL